MSFNKELVKRKQEYRKTGKCPEHWWVECNPIKTGEGEFTITSCFICKESYVKYHGQKVVGNLPELVEFLINRGLEYSKNTLLSSSKIKKPKKKKRVKQSGKKNKTKRKPNA